MKKFGTFGGVFTPTLLTILGVIMYLRLGWVVGNAGLLGTLLIIFIAFGITIATALSMSSITTNTRIGAGGAYAIISQALGLEVGGSLGIPRYISQGLAVTMYIFGFREGWLSIFPGHHSFLIDLIVFVVLYGIAYKSADLAIKTQYIIMVVIFASLIAIVLASYYGSMTIGTEEAMRWGTFRGSPENNFSGTEFWVVFAVFFPAATGIMAGANMSGELKDPRQSIPKGTLWAIGVSLIIYVMMAFWIARSATEDELISNYNIIIERSFWPPIIIAGVLGATFSSALGSIIGASRILFAMGQHRVLPQGKWLAFQDKAGQPRNSMIVTGILIFLTMLVRDLNAIAPLVTMFFLITYAMLNVVVIIEQKLGLISFRPQFKVHWIIPWLGLVGSLMAMFIINPVVSLISWALVAVVYGVLSRSDLETPFEDVRSGLFSSFAEWAAKLTASQNTKQERSWKPNLLIPTTDVATIHGSYTMIKDIAYPKGSAALMGISDENNGALIKKSIISITEAFKKDDLHSSWSIMVTNKFAEGVNFGNQALNHAFFKPNIIFLSMLEKEEVLQDYPKIIYEAKRLELGVLLYLLHPISQLGQKQNVNIWVRNPGIQWETVNSIGNIDLAMLTAYKLMQNWNATINLITVVDDVAKKENAQLFLNELIELSRLSEFKSKVVVGDFRTELENSGHVDLNIFGLSDQINLDYNKQLMELSKTSCLFVQDSGNENVLA